jgi:hypothetical protein
VFKEVGFVRACGVSGLSDSGVGVLDIPGAEDEDGGGGHGTRDINLKGVCVEEVGQRRVERDLWGKGGSRG